MKYLLFTIVWVFSLSGCAKLQHMDELLTLKRVADEQAAMAKQVEAQDKKFESLIEAVKKDRIKKYDHEKSVKRAFGEPIFIRERERDNQQLSEWFYRHSTEFFGSDKVYLYFDAEQKLVDYRYVERSTYGQSQ